MAKCARTRGELLQGILRVRKPQRSAAIEQIFAEQKKKNQVLAVIVQGLPEKATAVEKVTCLIKAAKSPEECELAYIAAECLVNKDAGVGVSLLPLVLNAVECRRVDEGSASFFGLVKKIIVEAWDIDRSLLVGMVLRKSFREEQGFLAGTALSEAFKTAEAAPEEMLGWLEGGSGEVKAAVYANLLLDRNHHLYFEKNRYQGLFQAIGREDAAEALNLVKERAASDVFQDALLYVVDSSKKPLANVVWQHFTAQTVLPYINDIEPEKVLVFIEECLTKNLSVKSIISECSEHKLLHLAKTALYRGNSPGAATPVEDEAALGVVEMFLDELEGRIGELVGEYVFGLGCVSLATGRLAQGLEERRKDFFGAKNLYRLLNSILRVDSEEDVFNGSVTSNCLYEAYQGQEDQGQWTAEAILSAYIEKRKSFTNPSLLDRAVCAGIRGIRGIQALGAKPSLQSLQRMLNESINGSALLPFILEQLSPHIPGAVHTALLTHATLPHTGAAIRSHHTHIHSVLEELKKEARVEVRSCATTYLYAVLPKLPFGAQMKIVREDLHLPEIWGMLIQEYRKNEMVVITSLLGGTHVSQFLPHGKEGYTAAPIHQLRGDSLFFVLMHVLDTKYVLQYLQVIDCLGALHTDAPEDTPTKWCVRDSSGVPALFYNGVQQKLALEPEVAQVLASKITATEEPAPLRSSVVYALVQAKVLMCLEKDNLRDLAMHALTGQFIDPRKEGSAAIQKMCSESALLKEALVRYMKKRVEFKSFAAAVPELAAFLPAKREKRGEAGPGEEAVKRPKKERTDKALEIKAEKEKTDARRIGVLIAHLAASKPKTEERNSTLAKEKLKGLAADELTEAAKHCFIELNRFWKSDREKISKNFESVIEVLSLLPETAELEAVQHIVFSHLKIGEEAIAETLQIAQKIFGRSIGQQSTAKALATVAEMAGTDARVVGPLTTVLGEVSGPTAERFVSGALESLPETSAVFQASLCYLKTRPESPHYLAALNKALSLLDTRNEEVLLCALRFMQEHYTANSTSPHAPAILASAAKTLSLQTKLDRSGVIALSIMEAGIFQHGHALAEIDKENLVASCKYDLYHYQNLLLHFISSFPIEEMIEIAGKINTPEARSARTAIRQAVLAYQPGPRDGIRILSKLLGQAQTGSAYDKIFILDLISEAQGKLAQGAWITLFLKGAELLANEENPAVEERLLSLIRQMISESRSKKQMAAIYSEWTKKEKLTLLVQKLGVVFE
ncbi:hypothetical protein NEDG_02134 [Nematocida displodere]|uniref:Uncharacterized protein n=1 Tax=Nematocida displodere TaxID=1805483 RepID=A0A177EJZ3_9MICR|nr:hypothetical protein NEDG_01444 [Nematocida displodere]OAG32267.1 hypothetical protein NEDG_02134 [Nematocida displodere]